MRSPFRAAVRAAAVAAVAFAVSSCDGAGTAGGEAAGPTGPSADEHARTIEALRPPQRARPVIAVLADNAGTETTDFLVPYGVLSESKLAEVIAVAPQPDPIQLMPALRVKPQQTTQAFDAMYPDGADYVIVPAMHHRDTPSIAKWIRAQAASGAIVVGICSGAMVLAEAGLLADRAATTHWFDIDELERSGPTTTRVNDRRYVVDRGIATTTGVTASVPMSLAIVEAIGGERAARDLATRLGADDWSAAHDSAAFRLSWRQVLLAAGNWGSFWSHDRIGIPVYAGIDEVALAFTADAYSRTFKTQALAVSDGAGSLETMRGLELIPDVLRSDAVLDYTVSRPLPARPVEALDETLEDIRTRYGDRVSAFVALQLEYPIAERREREPRD